VTLRTQPQPLTRAWAANDDPPDSVRTRLYRPSTLAWNGTRTTVQLEGHPEDVAAEIAAAGLERVDTAPPWPAGVHRGRISVAPAALGALAARLADVRCTWLAEGGVGTVHVATDEEGELAAARAAAEATGGWLLREAGASGLDPFGLTPPNLAVLTRVRDAFDPLGKLNPGRMPFLRSAA
jgi:hypothetical protein